MKTLNAKTKTLKEATKQIKRWFSKNPNRKIVKVELKEGTLEIGRI